MPVRYTHYDSARRWRDAVSSNHRLHPSVGGRAVTRHGSRRSPTAGEPARSAYTIANPKW